jgi:hypothetical protein
MVRLTIGKALSVGVLLVVTVGACGDEAPKNGNGVNDVKLACEIRTKWVRTGNDCSICESAAVSPRCECESLAAYSAACIEQADARKAACAESVDQCVYACDRTDCACIDACYANAEACKKASAARDGCVTEICKNACK